MADFKKKSCNSQHQFTVMQYAVFRNIAVTSDFHSVNNYWLKN